MPSHNYQDEYGVFVIPADENEPMRYDRIGHKLEDMKRLVGGGWIEVVRTNLMPKLPCGCRTVLVIDEEGQLKGLPPNSRASIYYPFASGPFQGIVGDAFLIGEGHVADREGEVDRDFISLPSEYNGWAGPPAEPPTPSAESFDRQFDDHRSPAGSEA